MRGMDESKIIDCCHFIEDNRLLNDDGKSYCILCGNKVDFLPYEFWFSGGIYQKYRIIGCGKRENAVCPICREVDRTRWCMYVIQKYTGILHEKCSVLHFAPEEKMTSLIKTNKECNYISADLKTEAMMQIDMTDIPFSDKKFDYVIANHVLEHILDEKQAIKELKRITKDDGLIILSVPICMEQNTIEDENINSEEDRLINYGLEDHVRLYGKDYLNRFEAYGLSINVKIPYKELNDMTIKKFGFIRDDIIMLCKKNKIFN